MTLQLCAVVDSIIAAFGNGMNISKRITALPRKQRKNTKNAEMNEEELQLGDSLVKRPQEIMKEYQNSVVRHGHQFEAGDPQSHSSLAQTLLAMNAGLIEIISHALSNNAKAKAMSRKSLLNLSEVAAADTLNAFAQLNDRLATLSQIPSAMVQYSETKHAKREKSKSKTGLPAPGERPAPSPLLARGGWIRSSSGSSIVSASEARREVVRKVDHKRSQSTPIAVAPVTARAAKKSTEPKFNKDTTMLDDKIHIPQSSRPKELLANGTKLEPPPPTQQRPPSMLIVPADYFEIFDLDVQQVSSPRPSMIPLHSKSKPVSRVRPLSGATFMTASTKIGEIPEDRLPERILSAEEQERIPMPYVIPPLLLEQPKKKRRGFRLWKRQTVAAC